MHNDDDLFTFETVPLLCLPAESVRTLDYIGQQADECFVGFEQLLGVRLPPAARERIIDAGLLEETFDAGLKLRAFVERGNPSALMN